MGSKTFLFKGLSGSLSSSAASLRSLLDLAVQTVTVTDRDSLYVAPQSSGPFVAGRVSGLALTAALRAPLRATEIGVLREPRRGLDEILVALHQLLNDTKHLPQQ